MASITKEADGTFSVNMEKSDSIALATEGTYLDKNIVFNVKDTNTTYSAGSNITLTGTTFSLTKANVTGALGYTPPTTDTNTWRPLGTGASDACAGNDSRLSNARPASDVYSWAKASSKPAYSIELVNLFTGSQALGKSGSKTISNMSSYPILLLTFTISGGEAHQSVIFTSGLEQRIGFTVGDSTYGLTYWWTYVTMSGNTIGWGGTKYSRGTTVDGSYANNAFILDGVYGIVAK